MHAPASCARVVLEDKGIRGARTDGGDTVEKGVEMSRYSTAEVKNRLLSIRHLKRGWDGYGATPPSQQAFDLCIDFIDVLDSCKPPTNPTRLAPSVAGGIALVLGQGGQEVFIEFYSDGEVYAMFSTLEEKEEPRIMRVVSTTEGFRGFIRLVESFLEW